MTKFQVQSLMFKVDDARNFKHQTLNFKPASARSGFTMIEIAICLAIIGFALVAIIGVLPIGMSVQKENREETIINFDATYLMDAIRSGSRGLDNLTNYVNVITNAGTQFNSNGVPTGSIYVNWYTTTNYNVNGTGYSSPPLTNGAVIMGLLTQPKYYLINTNGDYWSNTVTAEFRAITGSPIDQAANQTSKDFAFSYRVNIEVIPSASFPFAIFDGNSENFSAPGIATNGPANGWPLAKNVQANLNEIRLRFRWPVLPGNRLGNGSQVFRTSASGVFAASTNAFSSDPNAVVPPTTYFLIQSQSYAGAQ